MNCKHCGQAPVSQYCGQCGTPVAVKRIDAHYVVHEFQHILHLEKGILYTVRELLLRPGKSIRAFLRENRNRLVKPIIFLIVTSLIYTAVAHFFHLEKLTEVPASSGNKKVQLWIAGHYGYANMIMGIFIGAWMKLFCIRRDINFFEILVMLCYVMGIGMLIYAFITLVEGLFHINLAIVGYIVSFVYCFWAIAQFLGGKKIMHYVISVAAYLLGFFTFSLLATACGSLIDMLKQ